MNSAVVDWATEVSAEVIRSSAQASSVNGRAVPTMPAKATACQYARVRGSGPMPREPADDHEGQAAERHAPGRHREGREALDGSP